MSWLKRNGLALGALVVLVPATAFVVGGHEWWDYFSGRPVFAVEAETGEDHQADANEVVVLGGTGFGPAQGELRDPREFDAPSGTQVLTVRLPVLPGETGPSCFPPTLRETSTGRQWNDASTRITTVSMLTTSCQGADETEPYTVDLHYLVPDSAEAPFTLEITIPEALPRFARVQVHLGE